MAPQCDEEGLRELARLKKGWDSYGARPIDARAIKAVRAFRKNYLRPDLLPYAMPTSRGGIMLDWDGERYTIEFGPDGGQVLDD